MKLDYLTKMTKCIDSRNVNPTDKGDNLLTGIKLIRLDLSAQHSWCDRVQFCSFIVNSCAIDRFSNCKKILKILEKTQCITIVYGNLKHKIKRRHPRMFGTLYSAYYLVQTTPHEE